MNPAHPKHDLFDQMARVIWNGDVRNMLIDGHPYEQIEARIVTDLRRYGISGEMAYFMAPSALQCLRRTMAEKHAFPSGRSTRYLHKSEKLDRDRMRSCLDRDEILFCVERAERRLPLLKRLLPSCGTMAGKQTQYVLLGVTNRRVISVWLDAPDQDSLPGRSESRSVEWCLPLQHLQQVLYDPDRDSTQLTLISNIGSPRIYENLLPSAAKRLSSNIKTSSRHLQN